MPYFDPNTEAHMSGYALGRIAGERDGENKGFRAGQIRGYENGREDGYTEGWNAAIEVCNREMIKQKELTGQHIADKQRFQALAQEGRNMAELLRAEFKKLTEEYALLELENGELRKDELERVYQINYCLTFMSVAKSTLDKLISDADPEQVQMIRSLFTAFYNEQVQAGLSKKTFNVAPHADEEFRKMMPHSHKFLVRMLNAD